LGRVSKKHPEECFYSLDFPREIWSSDRYWDPIFSGQGIERLRDEIAAGSHYAEWPPPEIACKLNLVEIKETLSWMLRMPVTRGGALAWPGGAQESRVSCLTDERGSDYLLRLLHHLALKAGAWASPSRAHRWRSVR
jgi:hypothetical protein